MSGGQMPNMQQQAPVVPPVAPVMPDTNTGAVTPDLGAPTSLNVDLGAGTEASNNTNTTESSVDNTTTNTGIEEYEPEF